MVITPTKKLAAAREKHPLVERTIATELPQELAKLPEHNGFSGSRKKAGRPKKSDAAPKTNGHGMIAHLGFMDDGHPTILAAARG